MPQAAGGSPGRADEVRRGAAARCCGEVPADFHRIRGEGGHGRRNSGARSGTRVRVERLPGNSAGTFAAGLRQVDVTSPCAERRPVDRGPGAVR